MDRYKWDSYHKALKHIWLQDANLTNQKQLSSFAGGAFDKGRWIEWVEANAEDIPWCKELVVTAVTLRIQHEQN